ncbi:M28 family peptidase [Maribacter aurantiacus]|uniref:M28 family peptidase n=1 Tax=Maribacter aurantiacus TaxID=1882343 RepID=A0A5R8M5V1_9FLAO|nr:M28 family peptidase [Maribacter aurantiacus]TLF44875.1 M28 family peptidase [Maribacter aurantiacus]
MRKLVWLVAVLLAACNSSQKTVSTETISKGPVDPKVYAETITEAELKEHLYIYASDEFEGRETGQPGQKKAIAYLKAEYENLEIPPAQSNGDYFQKVPIEISNIPVGKLSIDTSDYLLGEHVLTFSKAQSGDNEIVYVGYGIEDDNYSDYQGMDIAGKLVLMKTGEPMNSDGTYTISGTSEKSIWSNMSESLGKRFQLAEDKGAIGVLYYDADNYPRFKSRFDYMRNSNSGRMSLKDLQENDFSSLFIDGTLAKAILPSIETDQTPKELDSKATLAFESSNEEVDSENVVAFIQGSKKPNEYIIISSHLDHIGITEEGEINNGADDDGSGTVALLEIAEAFKKAQEDGNGPSRSVVFLHVTGEEKGLLGSEYYTDVEPIFPLGQTVANLNIDMVGRIDPKRDGDRNYIYLIGSDKLSTELHELSEEVNSKYTQLELDYTYNDENDPNRFYYRSDHYNFAKNNIPIIFYFNGTHDDYHRPSDTPDKINYDLLENRTRLIFYTAWELANRANPVVVDKASD